jgi:hypothetical protein
MYVRILESLLKDDLQCGWIFRAVARYSGFITGSGLSLKYERIMVRITALV